MTVAVVDNTGQIYDAPDQEAADKAVSSGNFQYHDVVSPISNVPAPPDQSKEIVDRLNQTPSLNLKDVQTGEEISVPEDQAANKIRAGTHTTTDVPLVDKEGSLYDAPNAEAITKALQSGNFRLSTLAEREHARVQQEIQSKIKEESSDAGAFSPEYVIGRKEHSLWNQIARPFAPPEVKEAYEHVAEEAKEKNPSAYYEGATFGETLGLGAAGISGKVFRSAVGLSEAAPFLSKAGLANATIDAITYQAPAIAETIANRDPVASAEVIGAGIAGMGVLHGLARGAEKLAGAATEKLESQVAERTIADAAGITAKDSVEEATSKLAKYRQESPVIQSAFKALDENGESQSILQDAIHRANGEIEKLLPEKVATREAAEAEVSRLEKTLKAAKTPEEAAPALQAYQAAKESLSQLPKLTKADKATQTVLDSILEKTQSAAQEGTFAAAKDATDFLAKQAEEHTIAKEAHDIFVKNTLKAQADAALQSGDPKVIAGLRELTGLDNISKLILSEPVKKRQFSVMDAIHTLFAIKHAGVHPITGIPHLASRLRTGLSALGRGSAAKSVLSSGSPVSDYITHALQVGELNAAKTAKNFFSELQSNSNAKAFTVSGGLKTFLPDHGSGKSHEQQVKALRNLVNENKNPETFAANTEPVVSALKSEGLHKVADEYTQHQLRLMKVLDAFLPKEPTLEKANPFAPKMLAAEDVSPMAKAKYERALSIATDPTVLLDLIKTNQITTGDVAIAAATNPSTLAKLQDAVLQEAIKTKPDLSYQQRLSMSIFMAKNLDESTEETPILQSVYETPPPSGTSGKPSGGSKVSAKTADNLRDANLTVSQQAAGH